MSEWIKVTDKMPESYINVLVYNEEENWIGISCYDEGEGCWLFYGYRLALAVDYWMYLPASPVRRDDAE